MSPRYSESFNQLLRDGREPLLGCGEEWREPTRLLKINTFYLACLGKAHPLETTHKYGLPARLSHAFDKLSVLFGNHKTEPLS
jgi:hypothetical protein